jgi:hypothetical protein
MKRNSLTTAVIAGIAGVAGIANMAGAVNLNPDGLGQVLIYPYYTVRGGNGTLLSVVNTHNEGKAVKVRFLEGYNSREVLDFNLYLSPYDVWVAQVYDNGSGGSVATNDNSCTVPAFTQNLGNGIKAQPFTNLGYTQGGYTATQGSDTGPSGLDRTREGYVEMIEMGVVTNATKNNSLTAITHVSGVPKSCAQVIGAWNGGYWVSNPNIDMTLPTGGLFGAGSVINVSEGTIAAYDADAIAGFSAKIIHTGPGDITPNLAQATFPTTAIATSYVTEDNGVLITSTWPANQGVDAVSSVFDAANVFNEYLTDPAVGASSEWVVTFPTKRFYVDAGYLHTSAPNGYIQPFDELFGGGISGGHFLDPGESCFYIGLQYFDREERTPQSTIVFSPPPLGGANYLCFEAQVITFNQGTVVPGVDTAILGSDLAANVNTNGYTSGWLDLSFVEDFAGNFFSEHSLRQSNEGNIFFGLPATGFLVTNYVNSQAKPGVLGNYAGLYRHRFSRLIETSATIL